LSRKSCDDLEKTKRKLGSELSNKERSLSELTNENNLLKNKLENIVNEHKEFENELINVQGTLLQAESRENDRIKQTLDLDRLRSKEKDLSIENEKLKNVISKLETEISVLTKENQHEILKRDELGRQVNELQEK